MGKKGCIKERMPDGTIMWRDKISGKLVPTKKQKRKRVNLREDSSSDDEHVKKSHDLGSVDSERSKDDDVPTAEDMAFVDDDDKQDAGAVIAAALKKANVVASSAAAAATGATSSGKYGVGLLKKYVPESDDEETFQEVPPRGAASSLPSSAAAAASSSASTVEFRMDWSGMFEENPHLAKVVLDTPALPALLVKHLIEPKISDKPAKHYSVNWDAAMADNPSMAHLANSCPTLSQLVLTHAKPVSKSTPSSSSSSSSSSATNPAPTSASSASDTEKRASRPSSSSTSGSGAAKSTHRTSVTVLTPTKGKSSGSPTPGGQAAGAGGAAAATPKSSATYPVRTLLFITEKSAISGVWGVTDATTSPGGVSLTGLFTKASGDFADVNAGDAVRLEIEAEGPRGGYLVTRYRAVDDFSDMVMSPPPASFFNLTAEKKFSSSFMFIKSKGMPDVVGGQPIVKYEVGIVNQDESLRSINFTLWPPFTDLALNLGDVCFVDGIFAKSFGASVVLNITSKGRVFKDLNTNQARRIKQLFEAARVVEEAW